MLREPPWPEHAAWLSRHTPAGWIQAGLGELSRAEQSLAAHDRTAGVVGLRRAAGMALSGAMAAHFRDWGRTYADHLRALSRDEDAPAAVRSAAATLTEVPLDKLPGFARLTSPSDSARWIDAAKTVMAHAYAIVHGSTGRS